MGDLTDNLSRREFACKCGCGFDTIDFMLVMALQAAVDYFSALYGCRVSIIITGPNRCYERNLQETKDATSKSTHMAARASDFKLFLHGIDGKRIRQIDPDEVANWFEKHYPAFGIGRYHNRNHVDSRSNGPARWTVERPTEGQPT